MTHYVWNMETDPPELIGIYVRTEEDTIIYSRFVTGERGLAPADCVKVLSPMESMKLAEGVTAE